MVAQREAHSPPSTMCQKLFPRWRSRRRWETKTREFPSRRPQTSPRLHRISSGARKTRPTSSVLIGQSSSRTKSSKSWRRAWAAPVRKTLTMSTIGAKLIKPRKRRRRFLFAWFSITKSNYCARRIRHSTATNWVNYFPSTSCSGRVRESHASLCRVLGVSPAPSWARSSVSFDPPQSAAHSSLSPA